MNRVIQVSVDELGRIVIPATLHEQLHLAPGMTLVVEKGEQGWHASTDSVQAHCSCRERGAFSCQGDSLEQPCECHAS